MKGFIVNHLVNHFKNPYETTRIQWKVRGFPWWWLTFFYGKFTSIPGRVSSNLRVAYFSSGLKTITYLERQVSYFFRQLYP